MKLWMQVVAFAALLSVLWIAGTAVPSAAQGPAIVGPIVGATVRPVSVRGSLRAPGASVLPSTPRTAPSLRRTLPAPRTTLGSQLDPVRQISLPSALMPVPLRNFDGLNYANGGGWIPPDPNGDIGPNYYVQVVNVAIGIFNKDGTPAQSPIPYSTLFAPADPPCNSENNKGDPVVLYDATAQRWIISDFAWALDAGPFYECIAVSKGVDPLTSGWTLYTIKADPSGYMNDYPKLGVWPDGYYMSANMFTALKAGSFAGVRVWALDRQKMIDGQAMSPVSFFLPCQPNECYASLLPSHLRGTTPPAGSPNYFLSTDSNSNGGDHLHLWKFHVDWGTPANSTFTLAPSISVAPYQYPGINVIPQPPTSAMLDSVGDRLMMPLQYRHIGSTEALWANHTVQSGSATAIRWYEIRDPGGTPVVFQQGTTPSDGLHRWLASLAVDKYGNMAIGYSISGLTLWPSIRYSGRLVTDSPGVLSQGERTLIDGTDVQKNSTRWGDYSAMTVDPKDDCTFWYTNEYYKLNELSWRTRIGSFKFPICNPPAAPSNPVPADGSLLEANSSVDLAWTTSNVDTCRTLFWGGKSTNLDSGEVGACTAHSFGAQPPGLFHWQVVVTNTNGFTNGPSWTLKIKPSPPSNLVANPAPGNQMTLTWTKSPDDPDSVDSYSIYRADGTLLVTVPKGTTSTTVSGFTCPTSYTFYAKAQFQGIASNLSSLASGTTNSCPNGAPASLKVVTRTGTTIALGWVDASTNEDGFKVYRKNGSTFVWIGTVGPGVTSYTDTHLGIFTEYEYEVTAYNAFGETRPAGPVKGATGYFGYLPFLMR